MEALDPKLLFKILVVAKGFEPTFVPKVDPATGPLEIRLERFNRAGLGPKTKLRGRVLDPKGDPIVGAKVEPEGVQRGTGTSWGGLNGIDPLAITDENGEFLITSKEPFDALNVVIEARGFAKLRKNGLTSDQEHLVTMTDGVSVTGRVLLKGKPLHDVAVGMAGANRGAGEFVGDYQMGTDAEGRFTFLNLPPSTDYYIYGIMATLKDHGAIPAKRVRAGRDGTTTDIGELAVVPGLVLAGKVVLSDGTKAPPHTRLTVGLDDAWDMQYVELDEEGRFELQGIPPNAPFSVSTRIAGYRFSGKNASLDPWNPFMMMGKLNNDKTDLIVLFEPGTNLQGGSGGNVSPEDHPRNQPLRGAETPKNLSDYWVISGKVVDADSKNPIDHFQITPGRQDARLNRGAASWDAHRTEEYTNGEYTVFLPKRADPLLLMAEADGYLPAASPPWSAGQTNYDFALKKGSGPAGTVLLPNGEPAAGVSVFMFGPGEQFGLFADGQIRGFRSRDAGALTDPDGRFAFAPRLEEAKVYVATEHGFAGVTTQELANNSRIILQPWGRITGHLTQAGKPVTNETLSVTFVRTFSPDQPWANLQHRAVTDAEGRFEFNHLPPGQLQVVTLVPIDQGGLARGWTHNPQKVVTVKPGETVAVDIEKRNESPYRFGGASSPQNNPRKAAAKP